MDAYLNHITQLVNVLAMSGSPASDDDTVLATLEGLGPDFESFVTSVTTNTTNPVMFQDLQKLLADQECRMLAAEIKSTTPAEAQMLVNVVTASLDPKSNDKKEQRSVKSVSRRIIQH